jgi:hypothetical protein
MPVPKPRPDTRRVQRTAQQTTLRWLLVVAVWLTGMTLVAGVMAYVKLNRSPGELMRYAERRLEGHPKLEWVSKPVFSVLRPLIERPVDGVTPEPNVGPHPNRLPTQRYDTDGRPLSIGQGSKPHSIAANSTRLVAVSTFDELSRAIANAQPGDVIELNAGVYVMKRNMGTPVGGTPLQPITVRGIRPGAAIIESGAIEGFHITQPYWIFEDLVIKGTCSVHDYCEHAFHVSGAAKGTVIRNNRLEDFNAHVKVNGHPPHKWPDDGLIEHNSLRNNSPRRTQTPVTPIDIVGADRWRVTRNYIGHFIKWGSNGISYGVFMKGGGHDGVIEHNHIACTESDISQEGVRVGVSFGGGGSGPAFCRDGKCITEFSGGVLSDNKIEHCNDYGVYINKSNQILIARNQILNTYGIDVRFPESSAILIGNKVSGKIRSREGGVVHHEQDRGN